MKNYKKTYINKSEKSYDSNERNDKQFYNPKQSIVLQNYTAPDPKTSCNL